MRQLVLFAMTITIICAAAAVAAVQAGRYTGTFGSHQSKVTFTVSGGYVHNFEAFVPAYCFTTNDFIFETFIVPRAKIRAGKMNTTYTTKNSRGEKLGTRKLTAKFNGSRATGTLSGSDAGCTIATYKWTAHH